MKKFLLIFVSVLIMAGLLYVILPTKVKDATLGTSYTDSGLRTLVGSASNLKSVPKSAYFGNATTTNDATLAEPGDTTNQEVATRGMRKILLNITAVAPTATSTLYVRQMGSFDGTTYFDIATSTNVMATSTALGNSPTGFSYDPGTATTSRMVFFDVEGLKSTRFIIWSEGWTGHLDNGVQAYIQMQPIEDVVK